ncbi:hypothetical protein EDB85DRAFT_1885811 [Lactarius pseudohatsudake]|nr:hypothetical protein EDB85DRAFT_1885811 [Lactarius pseudohatsudake]
MMIVKRIHGRGANVAREHKSTFTPPPAAFQTEKIVEPRRLTIGSSALPSSLGYCTAPPRGTCLRAVRRPPSSGGSAREWRRKHHSSLLRGSQMRGRKDKRDGSVATGSSRARGASEQGVLFLPSSVLSAQLGTVPLAAPCLGNTYAGVNGLLDFVGRRDWTCAGCRLTAYEEEREKGESEIGRARHAANDQLKRVLFLHRSTRGALSTSDGSQAMMHVDTSMYGNEELRLDGGCDQYLW